MMELFRTLNKEYGKTILIVTHDMEQVFRYCDDVVVVADGTIRTKMEVKDFFRDSSLCKSMNILPPALIRMKDMLTEKGFEIPEEIDDIKSLAECVAGQVNHG